MHHSSDPSNAPNASNMPRHSPIMSAGEPHKKPNLRHPYRLPRAFRLNQGEVAAVIKLGKRIRVGVQQKDAHSRHNSTKFNLKLHKPRSQLPQTDAPRKLDASNLGNVVGHVVSNTTSNNINAVNALAPSKQLPSSSRIAIAVPKRLLKSAVLRNKIKRWIRESFRQHAVRGAGIDMLVTLEHKLNPKTQGDAARAELKQLFLDAIGKTPSDKDASWVAGQSQTLDVASKKTVVDHRDVG